MCISFRSPELLCVFCGERLPSSSLSQFFHSGETILANIDRFPIKRAVCKVSCHEPSGHDNFHSCSVLLVLAGPSSGIFSILQQERGKTPLVPPKQDMAFALHVLFVYINLKIYWSIGLSLGSLPILKIYILNKKGILMCNSNPFLLVQHWNNVTLAFFSLAFYGYCLLWRRSHNVVLLSEWV